MERSNKERGSWQRKVAVLIATAATLAAVAALRGPDAIGPQTADSTGAWLLSGPSAWNAQTLFGVVSTIPYELAGARGWQNLHVVVVWLAIVFWLLPLPPSAWRGMLSLIPALLAAVLSVPDAGLSGFGLAVLALSGWRLLTYKRAGSAATFQIAAWVAAWLSPGALPVILAFALEGSSRWPRARIVPAWLAALLVVNLTPRGLHVWANAWIFLRWMPEAAPTAAGTIAILLGLAVLALAMRWCITKRCAGNAVSPAALMLCASQGQTAYFWAAALMMIPLWVPAKEQLRALGANLRWWAIAAVVVLAALLAAWDGSMRVNDWYNLAMARETKQPTLTRDALPKEGHVYINPQGLALARFGGPLPRRTEKDETPRLGREPRLWRAQDRAVRYSAVWLLGDKSDYAPLARHLGESPDWRLAAVDATGLLFLREAKREDFPTESAQQLARGLLGGANRAAFLSGSALSCVAAQSLPEADELSRGAVRKSDLSSNTATARTLVLIALGQIEDALAESARAIKLTPDSSAAWQARAEALLHAGRADDAYAASQRAAELAPGDEGALWLAARSANAARAFQSEAEILEQLVALTEGRGADTGFYEFYLGQSYANQGLARPALRALEKAAAAPGLTDEQRAELEEEIARVREAAGRN